MALVQQKYNFGSDGHISVFSFRVKKKKIGMVFRVKAWVMCICAYMSDGLAKTVSLRENPLGTRVHGQ